jgi:hypothetical protein
MALSDDPWIKRHSMIDPERLHALGIITQQWNHCERNLWLIFSVVFSLHRRVAWIIGHDIGDISLCEKIKEMIKVVQPNPEVATVLGAYLKVYDACRVNRNTLTHFTSATNPTTPDDLMNAVFLRRKGPSGQPNELPSTLTDVRRVAEEVQALTIYSWKLYKALLARSEGKQAELPPTIVPPDLLWKPPPPTVPKPKRLPRSSRQSEPPEDKFH